MIVQKLYIKNMVCPRCIAAVEQELRKQGLKPLHVELGEAVLEKEPDAAGLKSLSEGLKVLGFELIDNSNARTIEKIKNVVIELVHHSDQHLHVNYSDFISQKLKKDYTYLSNLFSSIEGKTLEKYIIAQKIEKVKELLVYNELSLSEIADKLGYSSVAYLSTQFKKVTGLTPSHFKEIGRNKRKSLDQV